MSSFKILGPLVIISSLALPCAAATITVCSGAPGEQNNYRNAPSDYYGPSDLGCGIREITPDVDPTWVVGNSVFFDLPDASTLTSAHVFSQAQNGTALQVNGVWLQQFGVGSAMVSMDIPLSDLVTGRNYFATFYRGAGSIEFRLDFMTNDVLEPTNSVAASAPEPSTLLLIAAGGAAVCFYRRVRC
jgi:PEP-CTERM motif